VANLRDFFGKFAPELLRTDYGSEIWTLYVAGVLSTDMVLTGQFERDTSAVDLGGVLREIDDARAEDAARRLRMATAQ
jgi:RIO kinase 1